MRSPHIIVGVDGSPAAVAAVGWAAAEAAHRQAELVVVHVYDWRVMGSRAPIGGALAEDARSRAEALVEAAVTAAREAAPAVTVRGEALLGSAAPTLVSAADHAGQVVVGSRGRGGFASLLLGSVSQQVAAHAPCPVVVVRDTAAATTGPVVVGTDGPVASRHALGLAFEAAAVRGAPLVAVHAYTPQVPSRGSAFTESELRTQREAYERHVLGEDLTTWVEKYPEVAVETAVVAGAAATVLLDLAGNAQLVVVGSRGRDGLTGLLLGSVSQQVLHHAVCPVLVTR